MTKNKYLVIMPIRLTINQLLLNVSYAKDSYPNSPSFANSICQSYSFTQKKNILVSTVTLLLLAYMWLQNGKLN